MPPSHLKMPLLAMVVALNFASISSAFDPTKGHHHWVGDTIWSIPTAPDFYTNWSSSQSFQLGDTLYFEFDSGLHDAMQVSKKDYKTCSATNPLKAFTVGPATVPLRRHGVFYFICGVANHCKLGQKFAVQIPLPSSPSPSPSPSVVLNPHSLTGSPENGYVPSKHPNLRPDTVQSPTIGGYSETSDAIGRRRSPFSDQGILLAVCLLIYFHNK